MQKEFSTDCSFNNNKCHGNYGDVQQHIATFISITLPYLIINFARN